MSNGEGDIGVGSFDAEGDAAFVVVPSMELKRTAMRCSVDMIMLPSRLSDMEVLLKLYIEGASLS
jgi:hypothetical protein